jgi:hypothetical protein
MVCRARPDHLLGEARASGRNLLHRGPVALPARHAFCDLHAVLHHLLVPESIEGRRHPQNPSTERCAFARVSALR